MEEYGLRGFENKVLRNIAGGITGGGGGEIKKRFLKIFVFFQILLKKIKKKVVGE